MGDTKKIVITTGDNKKIVVDNIDDAIKFIQKDTKEKDKKKTQ